MTPEEKTEWMRQHAERVAKAIPTEWDECYRYDDDEEHEPHLFSAGNIQELKFCEGFPKR